MKAAWFLGQQKFNSYSIHTFSNKIPLKPFSGIFYLKNTQKNNQLINNNLIYKRDIKLYSIKKNNHYY